MTEILLDTQATPTPAANGRNPASPPLATPTVQPQPPGIAEFEGAAVASAVTKVTGTTSVDGVDIQLSIDDTIRVVGEFRVVKVVHEVDKDGQLVRVQYVKILAGSELTLVPWNPSDVNDLGIIRARPRP